MVTKTFKKIKMNIQVYEQGEYTIGGADTSSPVQTPSSTGSVFTTLIANGEQFIQEKKLSKNKRMKDK